MISLIVLLVPTTLPAAMVYIRQGRVFSIAVIIAVIVGLWFGADIGARLATRLNGEQLKFSVIAYILFMATYMGFMLLR